MCRCKARASAPLCSRTPCCARALLVHAKDDNAQSFYQHFDFEPSASDPYHLLLIMKGLLQIVGNQTHFKMTGDEIMGILAQPEKLARCYRALNRLDVMFMAFLCFAPVVEALR